MNKFRTFIKLAFFMFVMLVLQLIVPMNWAFIIVWAAAGLIGVERLFPGILKFTRDHDWVDFFIIALSLVFGLVTFWFAEYLGAPDNEMQQTPSKEVPSWQE